MIDYNVIWHEVCSDLSIKISSVLYSLWIEGLKPLCISNNALIIVAPSRNVRDTIYKSYTEQIRDALVSTKSPITDFDVIVADQIHLYDNASSEAELEPVVAEPVPSQFLSRYTFSNFIVGDSNKLAFHAAQTVAQKPGSVEGILSFNPLFIYGGVGLGKTHLLHSIGNYLETYSSHLKVSYLPTEKLTTEYFEALNNTSSSDKNAFKFRDFRDKYTNIDVLMLDDVQFLQKKTGLQEVVFHIFNDLYQAGKQIILTSDRPPCEIPTLADRLRSRFEGGLLADVGCPNLELRVAIIKKKLALQKLNIEDDVIFYLAEQFDNNIRELEGGLSKVMLFASLTGTNCPTIETAKAALKNSNPKPNGLDSTAIINAVCSYFNVSNADIISKKKTKDVVEARKIAIYLIYDILALPLVNIGQLFGGRDHATIIYSRDKTVSSIKENKDVARKVKDIRQMLST